MLLVSRDAVVTLAQAPGAGVGNVDGIKTPEGEGAFGFGFRLGPDFHRFVRSRRAAVFTRS